jgi:uncharacterized membrane protein YqjE
MDTIQLLKQEINQTLDSLHDFAKWKLIMTAALAAAALGLTAGGRPIYMLMLAIPYACAYVDLNCYQYLIRITVIARCLRELSTDEVLRLYECQCEELRKKYEVFDLGLYAQVGVSLAISTIAPIWALVFIAHDKSRLDFFASIGVWMLGLYLVYALWRHYRRKNKAAETGELPDTRALMEKLAGRGKAVTNPPLV